MGVEKGEKKHIHPDRRSRSRTAFVTPEIRRPVDAALGPRRSRRCQSGSGDGDGRRRFEQTVTIAAEEESAPRPSSERSVASTSRRPRRLVRSAEQRRGSTLRENSFPGIHGGVPRSGASTTSQRTGPSTKIPKRDTRRLSRDASFGHSTRGVQSRMTATPLIRVSVHTFRRPKVPRHSPPQTNAATVERGPTSQHCTRPFEGSLSEWYGDEKKAGRRRGEPRRRLLLVGEREHRDGHGRGRRQAVTPSTDTSSTPSAM